MTNIWGFLSQTISVSVVASIIFIVKYFLKDKLSPRWQYGVWCVLILRILMPLKLQSFVFFPIQVWVETWKGIIEKSLHSVYSEVYVPVSITHIFPVMHSAPQSSTDWIFVVYTGGILISLIWYLFSYLRLRRLLSRGGTVSRELSDKVKYVCEKYQLKSCEMVMIEGLSCPFVCGGFRPILALPAGKVIDEKIILHELLHLKYHDELQSMGWCLLRCIHWCNPLLQYVFNRIENDMESLCDQRVLERLKGEERREYGIILLDMANEKYARVPGTSSISNGGKNISRRIASIVHFKKYPKGMALVSVCIVLVLLSSGFVETGDASAYQYKTRDYQPQTEMEYEKAMALARVYRCTTVAGALDTYAKGLLYEQGTYIATASSLSKHDELVDKMQNYDGTDSTMYKIEAGEEFDTVEPGDGYQVYNLKKIQENLYEAYLVFSIYGWHDGEHNSLIVPVNVRMEDAWVVEEKGDRILSAQAMDSVMCQENGIPTLATYEADGRTGKVTIGVVSYCYVDNSVSNSMGVLGGTAFDNDLKLNAEFKEGYVWDFARYACTPDENGNEPETAMGIKYISLDSLDEKAEFPQVSMSGNSGGSDTDGFRWVSKTMDSEYCDSIETGGGTSFLGNEMEQSIPKAFKVQIYWDEELVEELIAEQTENTVSEIVQMQEVVGEFSQASVYMNEKAKIAFKKSQDAIYRKDTQSGKIQDISEEQLADLIEEFMFSEFWSYDEATAFEDKLASYGIYQFETTNSVQPNIYMPNTKVLYPKLFYNANDNTWIVACGGYCEPKELAVQLVPQDYGEPERFGVHFTKTAGTYDAYVLSVTANITDQDEKEMAETTNRSDGDGAQGFMFELQDYTYKDGILDSEIKYVGYRWYGACTYSDGFENYGGNVTAIYQHTE